MANENINVINHPLVQHKLSLLRDKNTSYYQFRALVHELSLLLYTHATQNLMLQDKSIQTPLEEYQAKVLIDNHPVIIPILRAGLGMVDAFINLIPTAQIGHIGLSRDETTYESHCYYFKIPDDSENHHVFICDPMLATGGTATTTISMLKAKNVSHITLVCIIASPEGIAAVHEQHADVPIYVCHIDRGLNENKYIVPGLGDAGDRICGTHEVI